MDDEDERSRMRAQMEQEQNENDTLGDLAYQGKVDALTARLNGGTDPNAVKQVGSASDVAVTRCLFVFVDRALIFIIKSIRTSVSLQFFSGASPLFCAARYGKTECVDALLKHNADVTVCHPE
jgi:hypothetical protein